MGRSYTYHDPYKTCPQCGGTGRMQVTNNVRIDYRSYSDSYVEDCGKCDGTGRYTLHWLSKDDYKRMVELDKRYENAATGRYVPTPKKKKSHLLYTIVGFGLGVLISGGNTWFGLFFAFLGLSLSYK